MFKSGLWAGLIAVLVAFSPCVVMAQGFPIFQESVPVAVVNEQRLFNSSLWGKRFNQGYLAQRSDLISENGRIEAALEQEEQDLADKRSSLTPDEFRVLAEEFDKKVIAIREEQGAKVKSLSDQNEEVRRAFFQAARPVIERFMEENGIIFILDAQAIFLGRNTGDITDLLIQRLDQEMGDGTQLP